MFRIVAVFLLICCSGCTLTSRLVVEKQWHPGNDNYDFNTRYEICLERKF